MDNDVAQARQLQQTHLSENISLRLFETAALLGLRQALCTIGGRAGY